MKKLTTFLERKNLARRIINRMASRFGAEAVIEAALASAVCDSLRNVVVDAAIDDGDVTPGERYNRDIDSRDIGLLAEAIAEGRRGDALELVRRMFGDEAPLPQTQLYLAGLRAGAMEGTPCN